MSEINLGDEVRDIVTGCEGLAICRQEGLFEATSVKVQQHKLNDDGRPFEPLWFEEGRLERVYDARSSEAHEARKNQS